MIRLFPLLLAGAGIALFVWVAYDAGDAAGQLGLLGSVGEAGVALGGMTLSGALLATAVALALRRRR